MGAKTKLVKMNILAREHAWAFTDASGLTETKLEGLGGVLILRGVVFYFMVTVTEEIAVWLPKGTTPDAKQQRINEAEAVGVVLLLHTFREELQGMDLTVYVDNTGAEGALKKGFSGSRFMTAAAAEAWDLAIRHEIGLWIERVPSKENIADPPSRGDDRFLKEVMEAIRVTPTIGDPKNYWFLRKPETRQHQEGRRGR